MEISCNDALTLFKKWNSDSTEIRGILEGVKLNPLLKFCGVIVIVDEKGIKINNDSPIELYLNFDNAKFEREEPQDAPLNLRDWADLNFSGLVIISSQFWRCSLFIPNFPSFLTVNKES